MKIKPIFLLLFVVGLYFSYGFFAYFQILIFGKVPFKSFFIKLSFIVLLFLSFLRKGVILRKDILSVVILIYLSYNIISFIALGRFEYDLSYWIFSFLSQQFWFFGVSLIYLFFSRVEKKTFVYIKNFLLFIFFLNFPIALLQFMTNKTILPVKSSDDYFKTMSFQFYDSIRAFGFMSSPLDFGLLSAMLYFIYLTELLFVRNPLREGIKKFFILILSIIGIYMSMTRNVILLVILGTLFLISLKRRAKLLLLIMPLLNFLISIVLIILGSFVSGSYDVLKNHSLLMRLTEWSFFVNLVFEASFCDKLMGMGIIQNDKFYIVNLPIDNLFLSILLYNGLLGLLLFLLLFLVLYYKFVKVLFFFIKERITTDYSVIIASGAFLSSFFAFSLFNNYYSFIYLFILVPLLGLKLDWRQK